MFGLRIKIYKKLIFEKENLKFEESVGERVKLENKKVDLPTTSDQKEFNNFLQQISLISACLKRFLIIKSLMKCYKLCS